MDDPGDSSRVGRNSGRRAVLQGLAGAGTLALSGLAGCNTLASGDGAGTRTGTGSGRRVSLEYVDVAGERGEAHLRPAVRALEEEHDVELDLTVTEVPYENMKSTLLTRVGGGNAPDIAAIDQIWLGAFIESGNLLTLDGVADDVAFDDFLPAFADVVQHDGHVYGFPIGTDVRGMYWNKALFEDAGLDPEAPPGTWDELVDVASVLHDPPETYGATYFVNTGRWTVNLFAAGGDVLDADGTEPRFHEEPGVRAAAFVDRLYNEEAVTPPEPVYTNGAQMARRFLRGQYAISVVEGSWLDYFWRNLGNETEAMLDRFGFAPTPVPGGGTPATMSGGFVWSAFESTEAPGLVRDFLRILNRREFIERLTIETRGIPTRRSLLEVPAVWDHVAYGDVVKEMLPNTRLRPVRNWDVVAETVDPALQRVAFDRREPREALEAAAETVRAELRNAQ